MAPVAAQVPLTLSEIGENDCAHGFVDTLMNWADAHAVGYLGWTWNNWDCSSGPALGTPATSVRAPGWTLATAWAWVSMPPGTTIFPRASMT